MIFASHGSAMGTRLSVAFVRGRPPDLPRTTAVQTLIKAPVGTALSTEKGLVGNSDSWGPRYGSPETMVSKNLSGTGHSVHDYAILTL
jgi:hypothetical protein